MKNVLLAALKRIVAVPIDIEKPREQRSEVAKQLEEYKDLIEKDLKDFAKDYVWLQEEDGRGEKPLKKGYHLFNSQTSGDGRDFNITLRRGYGDESPLLDIKLFIRETYDKDTGKTIEPSIEFKAYQSKSYPIPNYEIIEQEMNERLDREEVVKREQYDKYEKGVKEAKDSLDEMEKLLNDVVKHYTYNDEELEVERKTRSSKIALFDQDSNERWSMDVKIGWDGRVRWVKKRDLASFINLKLREGRLVATKDHPSFEKHSQAKDNAKKLGKEANEIMQKFAEEAEGMEHGSDEGLYLEYKGYQFYVNTAVNAAGDSYLSFNWDNTDNEDQGTLDDTSKLLNVLEVWKDGVEIYW